MLVLGIELIETNITIVLGLYFDASLQGFSFCPTKTFKPNKQTTWNTTHLPGNVWSSVKLDYDKLFAVFHDIKVMNAEVLAKGLEKYRLLTRLLGQNVEKLDDKGWPEFQDLVKTDISALVTFSDRKQGFTVPRGKQRCMESGLWNICNFLYVFFLFVFTTNLLLSTRHDFFSIAFISRNSA